MDLKNGIEYALFRALVAPLAHLSADHSIRVMAQLGRWSGSVLGIRRRVVEAQLAEVFPAMTEKERRRLAARIYDHLGRTAGEIFGPGFDALLEAAQVDPGWEVVDRALAGGRGALVATGHIGNFELGGAILARRYSLLDVVKTQRNPLGLEVVGQRVEPGRAVLAQLRTGGLVSLLVDQDAGAAGVRTEFLGRPASTWSGAARFSIRTGCPVIPMAMHRVGSGRHVLRIAPPLEPEGLADRPGDVIDFMGRISAAVEEFIRRDPEQWFWVHRRWKGAEKGKSA